MHMPGDREIRQATTAWARARSMDHAIVCEYDFKEFYMHHRPVRLAAPQRG
jgi:hypothetical protein